jgi:putative hydroxymethylpyrimidine transport system permease protein
VGGGCRDDHPPRPCGGHAALALALVASWEIVTRAASVPEYLLPSPSAIVRAGVENRQLLGDAAWVTTKEVVLGVLVAVAVALVIAVLLHSSSLLRKTVYPLLIASQTVPVVVFAPILTIAFGYGIEPILVIIALICFFPLGVVACLPHSGQRTL